MKMYRLRAVLILVITFTSLRDAEGAKQPFVYAPVRDLDSFHTFTPPDSSSYKTLTLQDDTQTLYIGGRDKVFGQSTADITKAKFQSVMWPVSKGVCLSLPQSNGGAKCYNLLQVVQPLNSSHVLICGTNSLSPENRYLVTEDGGKSYSLVEDQTNSMALCSFDPADSVTSLVVQSSKGPDVISTHRPGISSQISLVKMMPENSITSSDTMTGKMSTFVASFTDADATASTKISKVYVVSDEKTGVTGMPGPSPTITQVCANDIGGQNKLVNTWTSLLKVGLSCETTDDYPLKFDLITDMVPGGKGIVYGTFVTRHDTSRTNAVCSFRLRDIQAAFNSGSFWETQSKPYREVSGPTDGPRPGTCAANDSTSKNFSITFLNFMSSHNLVSDIVSPAYPPSANGSKKVVEKGPLLYKPGEKFTKIAVEQVTGLDGVVYDVIFVGKDNGQILKFVSIEIKKGGEIETVELAQYQPTERPIISMKLSQSLGQLYVGTSDGVHQLSTSNCEAYTKSCEFCDPCRMCILSRDPGCAWDNTAKKCVSVRNKSGGNSLLQDVEYGDAQTQCGDFIKSGKTTVKVADDGTEVFGNIITNPSIDAKWFRLKNSSTREQITIKDGKYRFTDGQLEIAHFDASKDAATYECQYTTGPSKTILNVSSYNVQADTYIPPLTPVVTVAPKVNGSGSPIDTSGKPGTESPQTTMSAPVTGSSVMIGIALGIALLILLIICITTCYFFRRQKAKKFSTGNKKYEATPINGSPCGEENKTNNNNAGLIRVQSEFDDRPMRPLLTSNDDQDLESNHIDPNQRNAKSLDNILDGGDQLDYIDDDDAASDKGPTRQSSMRDTTGRQRVPPSRTKSMPGSALYVVYGGKKLMCSTLQRNKQGTWTIQVQPNQSGMSDMAPEIDEEVIDIINDDSVNGRETFQPHPDNKSSSSLNTPDSKDTKDMKMARKAFFEGENRKPNPGSPDSTVQYMTSTPNNSSFYKPKIAPKPQHLLSDIKKQPLSEQKSRASLRSFGQNSSEDHDSDSTVKGSSSTLKPDTPPTVNSNTPQTDASFQHQHKHHNHHHSRHDVFEEVPTPEPTSDVPNAAAANKKKKVKKLARNANSFNNSSLNRSSGSSDGDDHLHGCDKDVKRKNRTTPLDSPSKQSRTSQGSSSSGDYKSARSSVVSEPYPEQR